MASDSGSKRIDLVKHAQQQGISRDDFLQAVRLLECKNVTKPRVGTANQLVDEYVIFKQLPKLAFDYHSISEVVAAEGERVPIRCNFFGLLGSNGALPSHFTDYARERMEHHGDDTFSEFINLFNHRMMSLFYRAWSAGEPVIHMDRREDDQYAKYLGSLIGDSFAGKGKRDRFSNQTKLYYAGLLSAKTRPKEGLIAIIRDYFLIDVQLDEFVGDWYEIPKDLQCTLSRKSRMNQLGVSSMLGALRWECQSKIRLTLGPLSLSRYVAFLKGGESFKELCAILRNYLDGELACEVSLRLKSGEAPMLSLEGGRCLGRTSWLGHYEDLSREHKSAMNNLYSVVL